MIRREDVADLRPGDVVEIVRNSWPDGTVVRGPVYVVGGCLYVASITVVDQDSRMPLGASYFLTVVSRAPRPLFVNHNRAEPVPGDVVRQENAPDHAKGHTWHYLGNDRRARWWRFDDTSIPFDEGAPLRLLMDGETGQAVPS